MTFFRAWRLLVWITIATLLLTMVVTAASILTLGLVQFLCPGSLATYIRSLIHDLQFVLLAMLHSTPGMVAV
ncbi:hypothetical protein NB069_05330 [Leclercia adecarboxylata]|uniref:hypothetical protein n=1 Tax=Leclercia adecarboxylata TaxID=83655 RepID=UPI00202A8A46|nr:hypothetical protein [Leclercia adecarboxylata]URO00310.1 hypothetical protein NB069_05330 [Leclercia adecarboxylata]